MAIDTLKQAIALDASFAVAHYLIANMYAADQQLAAAATHYKKYLQLDPQGANAAQARERLAIVERGSQSPRRGSSPR
jgi:predicted TPR repeat methyltransferase